MRQVGSKAEVRAAVAAARGAGKRVALVPTMGALHDGHLALVAKAHEVADWVALSIFVNPLQFGPAEDLDRYPRTLDQDAALAAGSGADLLFAPTVTEMYGDGPPAVAVVAERLADRLCGASRPGHFRGVLTVVAKLFGIFSPDVAVFGQKDFQQAALIRRMVGDLDFAVQVVVAPTVREADGLAMSSRNQYLAPADRAAALGLWQALQAAHQLWEAGERDPGALRRVMTARLSEPGIVPEYAELVDAESLERVERAESGTVAAVAARVGSTRLIDNLVFGS